MNRPAAIRTGTARPATARAALWWPESGCGPHCLPQRRALPSAGVLRTSVRLLGAAATVASAVPLLLFAGARADAAVRALARWTLWLLGVRHELRGMPPRRAVLVVANHVSWLDILVLLARLPVRVVAKGEVRRWPVVGAVAAAAGTLFLDRSRPSTLPAAVAAAAAVLRSGRSVAVFPEATTWCGADRGRFRPAMFQAALDAGAAVLPVTVGFRLADGRTTTAAAFVGTESLVASVFRVAALRGLRVSLRLHPALYPVTGASRRAVAAAAHAYVTGCSDIGHRGFKVASYRAPAGSPPLEGRTDAPRPASVTPDRYATAAPRQPQRDDVPLPVRQRV